MRSAILPLSVLGLLALSTGCSSVTSNNGAQAPPAKPPQLEKAKAQKDVWLIRVIDWSGPHLRPSDKKWYYSFAANPWDAQNPCAGDNLLLAVFWNDVVGTVDDGFCFGNVFPVTMVAVRPGSIFIRPGPRPFEIKKVEKK